MTFLNEYISDEDRKKYDIEELYIKYNPHLIKKGVPDYKKLKWTVDKDRDIFLMRMRVGREELSHHSKWVLFWEGRKISVELARASGGSKDYHEVPYVKIWDLVSITQDELIDLDEDLVVKKLKEALVIFGDDGANSYVDNVVVKFNF